MRLEVMTKIMLENNTKKRVLRVNYPRLLQMCFRHLPVRSWIKTLLRFSEIRYILLDTFRIKIRSYND